MTINSIFYKQTQQAIGSPEDQIATDTTTEWSSISLLKAIFGKLGGGTATVVASDVAQGSTTAGQTGGLVQGAVTTAAPSYTTGKTNPLSLEPDGDLRTHDDAATTLLTTLVDQTNGVEGPLSIMDDWDESDRAKVNPIVGQAGVAAGSGAVGATVQRVVLATDDPAVTVLGAQADAASATTSIKAALRAIATALGTTALDLGSGTGGSRTLRTFQDTAQFVAGAGAVTSAVQRVTLASDDPAVAVLGATADAAATAGSTGSLSAKLRLMTTQIASLVTGTVLAAGTALIGKVGIDQTTPGTTNAVAPISGQAGVAGNSGVVGATTQRVTIATDDPVMGGTADAAATAGSTGSISAKLRALSRDLVANIVLAAGSNLIGRTVADASAATGGIASTSRIISAAASTNGTSAKASAGRLYAIQGYNAASSVRYLKLYNKASAPTVGTDTPVKTIALPALTAFALDWPLGYSFATGIAYALTTGSADADTGALTAGDVLGLNVDYS